jgi:hypothetical protein
VHGNNALHCTVTPKVHLKLKHVAWQMRNIQGGLGNKIEDWVEQLHQTGTCLQECFRRVKSLVICAQAWEKANSHSSHPNVIAHTDATNAGNKHSFSAEKVDDTITKQ